MGNLEACGNSHQALETTLQGDDAGQSGPDHRTVGTTDGRCDGTTSYIHIDRLSVDMGNTLL
ncbi:hypothetical protein ACP4OV_029285 [Aristida adscensionis]